MRGLNIWEIMLIIEIATVFVWVIGNLIVHLWRKLP
jgi:hypothetical protein